MKRFIVLLSVFIALTATVVDAQRRTWALYLPNIHCYRLAEAEAGEDELYLLITWKASHGSTGSVIVPNTGDWSMNDGDHLNNNISPNAVYGFTLADGESIDVVCTMMVRDGGTPVQYLTLGKFF